MTKKNISILVKRVGCVPVRITVPNTLEMFQSIVGGYIETAKIHQNINIVCNEEGLIKGLPYNCQLLPGLVIYGDFAIIGAYRIDFSSLSPEEEDHIKLLYPQLWHGSDYEFTIKHRNGEMTIRTHAFLPAPCKKLWGLLKLCDEDAKNGPEARQKMIAYLIKLLTSTLSEVLLPDDRKNRETTRIRKQIEVIRTYGQGLNG